jgi:plasmid stability protein
LRFLTATGLTLLLVRYQNLFREAPMPTITLRNIPPDLYQQLKESAAANHRSINNEIISHIERGVRGRKVDPEALIARARKLRQKTRRRQISGTDFKTAKQAGHL